MSLCQFCPAHILYNWFQIHLLHLSNSLPFGFYWSDFVKPLDHSSILFYFIIFFFIVFFLVSIGGNCWFFRLGSFEFRFLNSLHILFDLPPLKFLCSPTSYSWVNLLSFFSSFKYLFHQFILFKMGCYIWIRSVGLNKLYFSLNLHISGENTIVLAIIHLIVFYTMGLSRSFTFCLHKKMNSNQFKHK